MMFGCPVHTQHKERMFCQTKGVSICPHTFGCPICLNAPCMFRCHHVFGCTPCMFECHHMFGWSPVCLDAPHMFGHPYILGCPLVCLDTPCLHSPICLDAPYMFGCPHMFGHPLYVWMPSICLAASLYVWMLPNVWWQPKV